VGAEDPHDRWRTGTRLSVVQIVTNLILGAVVGTVMGLWFWWAFDDQFPGLGAGAIVTIHAFAWSCGCATSGVIVGRERSRPLNETIEAFISGGVAVALIAAIGRDKLPLAFEFLWAVIFSAVSWAKSAIRRVRTGRPPSTPSN
jgi:hypothetical protein